MSVGGCHPKTSKELVADKETAEQEVRGHLHHPALRQRVVSVQRIPDVERVITIPSSIDIDESPGKWDAVGTTALNASISSASVQLPLRRASAAMNLLTRNLIRPYPQSALGLT